MNTVINPVRKSFTRAALTYESAANLQQQVAFQLSEQAQEHLETNFSGTFLDAGCGTGYCLKHLFEKNGDARFIALDFAQTMLQRISPSIDPVLIVSDLQNTPLQPNSIDVYVSSLAWQWCNPSFAAKEACRVLKQGGKLSIATLSTQTFKELNFSLKACGLNPDEHLLHYPTEESIAEAISDNGFSIANIHSDEITTWHQNFKSLRHSIRDVGANQHSNSRFDSPFNRQIRNKLIQTHERLRQPLGLPLTYEVLYIHATKI